MRCHPFLYRTFFAGHLFVLAILLTSSASAADKVSSGSPGPAVVTASAAVAAGSPEDSLQACLARIPKDATVGQRMIAEQSCRRDEGIDNPFKRPAVAKRVDGQLRPVSLTSWL